MSGIKNKTTTNQPSGLEPFGFKNVDEFTSVLLSFAQLHALHVTAVTKLNMKYILEPNQ